MNDTTLGITYIGGPTALLELAGARLLTDPTLDPAGGEYPSGAARLRKLAGPSVQPDDLGAVDAVLLSHDRHPDNLDAAGRAFLARVPVVLTTPDAAERLGGNAVGLAPWKTYDLATASGRTMRVVATPCRHGPAGMDRGPVVGFLLQPSDDPMRAVYFSGDTVWYEGVAEVWQRFAPRVAVLNLGAARVPEVGPFHLTMTAEEAVEAARAFAPAAIVPLHFEGWAHFSEGRGAIEQAFAHARMQDRLRWPEPGRRIEIAV
jgi:L-ascorbate metabolism protein UlaG (beta-lactamase superfamily)